MVPILMFVILLIIQFVMYFNSANAARQAAEVGLDAARTATSNGARVGEGTAAASQALQQFDANLRGNPSVNVSVEGDGASVGGTRAVVRITGLQSISLIPGLQIPINITVSGPVEDVPPPA